MIKIMLLSGKSSLDPQGEEFGVLDTGFFETPDPGSLERGIRKSRTGGFGDLMASLRVVFSLKMGFLISGRGYFGKKALLAPFCRPV